MKVDLIIINFLIYFTNHMNKEKLIQLREKINELFFKKNYLKLKLFEQKK